MDPSVLARKQLTELKGIASHLQMRGYQRLKKAELIDAIVAAAAQGSLNGSPEAGTAQQSKQSSDAGESAPPGNGQSGDSGEGRTRTRTRTRERTVEDRAGADDEDNGRAQATKISGHGDAAAPDDGGDARRSRGGSDSSDGGSRQRQDARGGQDGDAGQDGGSATSGGGDGQDQQAGQNRDDDESGGRRRRSRRERRRNKGGAPPARPRERDDEAGAEPGEVRLGVLDVLPEGYGFVRTSGYLPGDRDVYVSQGQIRKHGLRRGDLIEGPIRNQRNNEKVPGLHHVAKVNGTEIDQNAPALQRPDFKDMTPLFPDERLPLETPDGPISMRIIDLMAPIGKGQRGLIVSPPKAGKTTILKELGQAIARNNPEVHLMVVLVDERPEEVTDMQRSIPGEVIASTFDRPADDHTQIAELAIERAKRLVESGGDVVILLDSITRLSRAYNLAAPASGRIMSGGVDSSALYPPKRFFGAARNIEDGGSLTIIASALIETGSKMDEVIFEEFKGTGNMELRLDRRLEQKRIFPAIDLEGSGTRKEELLIDREELAIIWKLRRVLHALDGPAALELLIDKMKGTRSNNQFLVQIQKSNLQAP